MTTQASATFLSWRQARQIAERFPTVYWMREMGVVARICPTPVRRSRSTAFFTMKKPMSEMNEPESIATAVPTHAEL